MGKLKEFYKQIFKIENCINSMKKRFDTNDKIHAKIEVLSYHINHRILEERARQKIRDGKRLKVFFLVSYPSKFGFETIYQAMLSSDIFMPYIFVVHPRDKFFNKYQSYVLEAKEAYELFLQQGYNTIFGYDEMMRPTGLEKENPDIIFLNFPNMFQECHYKNININYNYLTCYIPYGMHIANNFGYHFENYHINTSWKIFDDTYFSYYRYLERSIYNGLNVVLAGYPKLDCYYSGTNEIENRKRKCVIYAPHWSIKTKSVDNNMSTFHLYQQYFLKLLDKYSDIDFYFKPHPDLKYRIQELYDQNINIGISPKEYEKYINIWKSKKNGYVLLDGTYIPLFQKSDCLITDSISFIAEFLPSNHPCIFLLNPEKEDLYENINEFGKEILSKYYCCLNEVEIESAFKQCVIEENDNKKTSREDILEREFINLGNSGVYICDYLTKILT